MYPTLQTGAHCVMALIILCTTVLIGTSSNGQMLRPTRAVYDLQLNKDRASAKIVAATGRLVVELIEDCSGFISNQAFISQLSSAGGPDLVGIIEASVWESRDGRTLRFSLTNRINGAIVLQEQGRADLTKMGDGNAVWHLPKSRKLKLPLGTLFPISHNRLLLQEALAGSRGFEVPLFDGSSEAGYYHAAVFIGTPLMEKPHEKLSLSDLRSWPVRLAYYHFDSQLGIPEIEVGFMLYGDGVVDSLRLDYQEFGLIGRLVELEYLDQPECE